MSLWNALVSHHDHIPKDIKGTEDMDDNVYMYRAFATWALFPWALYMHVHMVDACLII